MAIHYMRHQDAVEGRLSCAACGLAYEFWNSYPDCSDSKDEAQPQDIERRDYYRGGAGLVRFLKFVFFPLIAIVIAVYILSFFV